MHPSRLTVQLLLAALAASGVAWAYPQVPEVTSDSFTGEGQVFATSCTGDWQLALAGESTGGAWAVPYTLTSLTLPTACPTRASQGTMTGAAAFDPVAGGCLRDAATGGSWCFTNPARGGPPPIRYDATLTENGVVTLRGVLEGAYAVETM